MKIKKAKGSFIQVEVIEEKQKGTLLIEDQEKDYLLGKIISIGEGVLLSDGSRRTSDFEIGEYVLFIGTGRKVESYSFIYASSIICTVEI